MYVCTRYQETQYKKVVFIGHFPKNTFRNLIFATVFATKKEYLKSIYIHSDYDNLKKLGCQNISFREEGTN